MNIENHAEHIRDLLSRHAPQDQRRLLHDLLTTIPEQEEPSLTKSDDYLCTFEHLLFSAIFPHVGNPKPPWNNGITCRRLAWQWIMDQLTEVVGRENWPHRACLPKILEIANKVLVTWANCEYPLRFPPSMLMQFGIALSSLSSHCMYLRGWHLEAPPACSDLAREYIEAFLFNWADDDRRTQRELVKPGATDSEEIVGKQGEVLPPPSLTGAIVPPVPDELFGYHPRMWSHSCSEEDEQDHETASTKRHRDGGSIPMESHGTSKRMHVDTQDTIEQQCAAPSTTPPSGDTTTPPYPDISMESAEHQQTQTNIAQDDEDFIHRYQNSPPEWGNKKKSWVALSLDLAAQQCMFGWPAFETLYGHPNNPTLRLHDVFAETPFKNLKPNDVIVRDGTDPVLRALHAIKAVEVAPETFRMCDGMLGLDTPLKGSAYRVWSLESRNKCARSHEWSVGLRIGLPATGSLVHRITKATQTPPGLRKANFREALSFLQAEHQIGVPATQSTDAHLGFAFYAYQSASAALPPGDSHKHILLRVEGTASRGGSGQSLQKAKVGFCPCCSVITHIAVPPSYEVGDYVEAKFAGIKLWQQFGPWAPRYLAAHQYHNAYGYLSTHWDWAASGLDIKAPPPLSLSEVQKKSTPPEPVHAKPSPPTPSLHVHQSPSDPMTAEVTQPTDEQSSSMHVHLSSCIPDAPSCMRDLSQFLVDDFSPPLSRRSRCSDGRDLSTIKRQNYPRGGHREDPPSSSSKDGWSSKSRPAPAYSFGFGKPPASPISSLHERPPSVHVSSEYGKARPGKTKPDAYPSYTKGKGNTNFKGGTK